jgi:hypothetical protein
MDSLAYLRDAFMDLKYGFILKVPIMPQRN